jgi:hypothetical protein
MIMTVDIRTIPYRGWANNTLITNGQIELVVTQDVGPRIIRLGFVKGRNLMAEFKGEMGGSAEKEWMIRGGHRLWLAPEAKPETYELDNVPVKARMIENGVRTTQPAGDLTGIQKVMDIQMAGRKNVVTVTHTLKNAGRKARALAPWALTVMAPGGMCIIPLPKKIAHTARLTHNQEWSIWGYTDFSDGRWTLGPRYVFFRQDRRRGPGKLGIAHREGWVAYQLADCLFVKQFQWTEGAVYPDGGVNFETFSNEQMLEVETLGPLVTLKPGQSVKHVEVWKLFQGVKPIKTEADADAVAKKLLR